MIKRLVSFLVALTLVLSVLPADLVVSAEPVEHSHNGSHKCS